LSVDNDSDDEVHGVADDAGEADQPKDELMQFPEAAE
jgi:hypothetical protein